MCWSIVADVWYAVTQANLVTIPLQRSMSTDLQISNALDTHGSH
jgi:hypothetical protein